MAVLMPNRGLRQGIVHGPKIVPAGARIIAYMYIAYRQDLGVSA